MQITSIQLFTMQKTMHERKYKDIFTDACERIKVFINIFREQDIGYKTLTFNLI